MLQKQRESLQALNKLFKISLSNINSKPLHWAYFLLKFTMKNDLHQDFESAHALPVKGDSHPAFQALKELSSAVHELYSGSEKKAILNCTPILKKNLQFMIDTFHMKAIRMIHMHTKRPMAEIIPLVKRITPIIDKEETGDLMTMQQLIEWPPEPSILVMGSFHQHGPNTKWIAMPILETFKLITP